MDTVHTTAQKMEKIQALINAVHKLKEDRVIKHDPVVHALVESLSALASEADSCLESLLQECQNFNNDVEMYRWFQKKDA